MSEHVNEVLMDARRRAATLTALELLARKSPDPSGAIDALEELRPDLAERMVAELAEREGVTVELMRGRLASMRLAGYAELERAIAAEWPMLSGEVERQERAAGAEAKTTQPSAGGADLEPRV